MAYPVTDNNGQYNNQVVKILFIPHREDVNTSKAQTPNKLEHHRHIHVAEIKRDDITLSMSDDVKKTHLSSWPSNSESRN
jgi:hypothetical protein